jgi:hypothetical protein
VDARDRIEPRIDLPVDPTMITTLLERSPEFGRAYQVRRGSRTTARAYGSIQGMDLTGATGAPILIRTDTWIDPNHLYERLRTTLYKGAAS